MHNDWEDLLYEDCQCGEEALSDFYCPYTNTAECALMTKGWQPQELCDTLDCEQLKLIKRSQNRSEAA